jgi:hypothetical protein
MLLKGGLSQKRVKVFDKKTGRAIGFERCLSLSRGHCGVTEAEAGVMRAIDSLRDAAQHWIVVVAEEVLYLHARGLVTVFDDILKRVFDDELVAHLPLRVLPVSTMPPVNFDLLLDREYRRIAELLMPGRRARDEARGRIRTLLAMESHVVEEVEISEKDINRIERGIRGKKSLGEVFPRLTTLATRTQGEGLQVRVHFTKKGGAPVRFVSGDDPQEAAAVREVDLRKKFHMGAQKLAQVVGLTHPKAAALRKHLGLDTDPQCVHTFEFGKSRFAQYSDNATTKMKAAVNAGVMDDVWRAYQSTTKFGGRRSSRRAAQT